MLSAETVSFSISDEMRRKVEALRDSSAIEVNYTNEVDAVILEYYEKKNKHELCKLLGISENTLRKRYRMLKEKHGKTQKS